MAAVLNDELKRCLSEALKIGSGVDLPVIVTCAKGIDRSELERRGLTIHHHFESILAFSGSIPAGQVGELAQLEDVVMIEYDGQSHALGC